MAHKKNTKLSSRLCFPVSRDEIIWLHNNLNKSEFSIFLYIAARNPYGAHFVPENPEEIMRDLNIHKATYHRAIATLTELNLLENITVETHFRPVLSDQRIVASMRQEDQKCDRKIKNATERSKMRHESHECDNQQPELPPGKGFGSLRSNRSNRSTRSIEEREKCFDENDQPTAEYRDWLIRRTQQFDKPVALIEDWLDHNATKECNIRQFLKSKNKPTPQDCYSATVQPVEKVDEEPVDPFTKEFLFNQGCWNLKTLRRRALDWAEQNKDRVEVTEEGLRILDDPSPT